MIYNAVTALVAYLQAGYQDAIAAEATSHSLSFAQVKDYNIGWQDPFTLSRYPGAIVVPDGTSRNVEAQVINLPVWIFVGYRHTDPAMLTKWQLCAIDAAYKYLNEAEVGTFRAYMDDAVSYTPTSGIGIVELQLTIEIDILGGKLNV